MSNVSSSEVRVSFDYASSLNTEFITYVPSKLENDVRILWPAAYGAYVFQAAGDPTQCTVGPDETYNTYEVMDVISDVMVQVRASKFFSAMVTDGIDMYILASLSARVQGEATKLTVASLLKYMFTVLQIRQDAYNEYESRLSSNVDGPKANVDWLLENDPRNSMFQDRMTKRELLALGYIGSELHQPLLKADREQVDLKHDFRTRMWRLFESPRFKAYKSFVYDKSSSGTWNASSWLKAKAIKVIMTSPVVNKSDMIQVIHTYSDSMRTSTTGSVISSPSTVFAPKNVEGDRLITNLFKYHLPQVLDGEYSEEVKICIDHLEKFLQAGARRQAVRV